MEDQHHDHFQQLPPPQQMHPMGEHMGMPPPNLGPPPMHHQQQQQQNMMPPPHMGHPPPPNNANMLPPHPNMGPPPNFMPPPMHQQQQLPPPQLALEPPGIRNDDDGNANEQSGQELQPLMSVIVDKPDELKGNSNEELILPKALEDVFAFKHQLADEFGRTDGEIYIESEKHLQISATGVISTDYADADADSEEEEPPAEQPFESKQQSRIDKNRKKKLRKKQNRKLRQEKQAELEERQATAAANAPVPVGVTNSSDDAPLANGDKENGGDVVDSVENGTVDKDDVTVEYVAEKITVAELAPMYRQFYRVFEMFKLEDKPLNKEPVEQVDEKATQATKEKDMMIDDDDEDMEQENEDDKEKLSKRKLKKLTRLSVAELKQLVNRPDVVEMHDVTARDPKLLVQLKAHRNTVQVPRHWCFKRKYLQGKRGIEKPPFDLPAFIKKTGIMEMRASLQEKDEAKTLKSKMRERVRPKMGKIDIDYQKLHDAFFKWQTKPRMTIHGDLYYEGKEFETRLKEKKPGDLSEELRTALGMPIGPNCHKVPPPWLIAQQRYGPPPSYPNLKIPGLNAPIPEGTSFGYHAGGWGKPPVDEKGKPLYGDVFGTSSLDPDSGVEEGDIERNMWGELESESEESTSEEEEEGEDLGEPTDESGLITPAEGMVTPSGLTSIPAGMETPDTIELRKKKIEAEMEDNETPVLYQVLPEKRNDRIASAMMASTHVYDMTTVGSKAPHAATGTGLRGEGTVELALDPSELDLDNDAMAQRYEQQMREQQSHLQKEDLSDMLAEHVAKQKSKRKRQQGTETTSKQTKKYKEFKF